MAGYVIDESRIKDLQKIGVRDSKELSPVKREMLEKMLMKMAETVVVLKLSAEEIDKMRIETNLNRIEARKMKDIINSLDSDKVFIDSVEANTDKFKREIIAGLSVGLKRRINQKNMDVICENFADKKYPVVAAASIIAKVNRDKEIDEFKKEYGNIGSGYSSDPVTIKFLKDWIEKNKNYPGFVRQSWLTAKEIMDEKKQKAINDFIISD
ncbi:MAG: ribonuclease HII [Candidatus Aenigmarchaeota archaeon]|nr:ribonuclease HII [Candidatus Aenigmarchaeota archaeon]